MLLSGHGAASVAPADGKVLWEYPWPSDTRILQPAQTSDGDILVGCTGRRRGCRPATHRIRSRIGWLDRSASCWTSNGLKPYFNDFVVHHGLAFGFDGFR